MFRLWPGLLPSDVELCAIQLPGRGQRLDERPVTDMRRLTDSITEALLPELDLPFLLFGHSMGAILAYEVAQALALEGGPSPAHLLVSGRRAPSIPTREPDLHRLEGGAFIDAVVARYDAIPAALRDNPDVLALIEPALRADLTALETHRVRRLAPLACPITAFAGSRDALATPADMRPWCEQTAAEFRLVVLPGGHFYFEPDPAALAVEIGAAAACVHALRASPIGMA